MNLRSEDADLLRQIDIIQRRESHSDTAPPLEHIARDIGGVWAEELLPCYRPECHRIDNIPITGSTGRFRQSREEPRSREQQEQRSDEVDAVCKSMARLADVQAIEVRCGEPGYDEWNPKIETLLTRFQVKLRQLFDFPLFVRVTDKGRELLESREPACAQVVTKSQCAGIAGVHNRTIERRIMEGSFPYPDFAGGAGVAHKWLWSNVRGPLEEIAGRPMPDRFPADKFIGG